MDAKTVPMEIFDPLRRKNVKLTPEEGVRQGFVKWLADTVKVPLPLMMSEYSFVFNGLKYRSDIVVFDRSLKPLAMVECKAPEVRLDHAVIDQVIRYNNVLKVKFIFITNGQLTYLCKWNQEAGKYEFSSEVPDFETMLQTV